MCITQKALSTKLNLLNLWNLNTDPTMTHSTNENSTGNITNTA
jgi:hypothetical protein